MLVERCWHSSDTDSEGYTDNEVLFVRILMTTKQRAANNTLRVATLRFITRFSCLDESMHVVPS